METHVALKHRRIVLSFFGVGYLPWFPGTWASIVTGIALMVIRSPIALSSEWIFLIIAIVLIIGLKTGMRMVQRAPQENGRFDDASWIVLDEVLGTIVAMTPVLLSWHDYAFVHVCISVGVFRFFDIVKPFGISTIDRKGTAWSIFGDDLLAGLYAALVSFLFL